MATEDCHTVIVTFDTEPQTQGEALERIGAYARSFLSKQPGFIESFLHQSLDGTSIVHLARWTSEGQFKTAGEKARAHPDFPALMAYSPKGRGYRVWRSY